MRHEATFFPRFVSIIPRQSQELTDCVVQIDRQGWIVFREMGFEQFRLNHYNNLFPGIEPEFNRLKLE